MSDPHNDAMRQRSGALQSSDALTSFFYELVRDHLPLGVVEGIVRRVLDEERPVIYTNGWLAEYCDDITRRLNDDRRDYDLPHFTEKRSLTVPVDSIVVQKENPNESTPVQTETQADGADAGGA